RQRFPEQNTAIATLPVKSIKTIENPDDESGAHDERRREIELVHESMGRFPRILHVQSQTNDADQRAAKEKPGGRQGRNVNGTVLPQLSPNRPVHRTSGGYDRGSKATGLRPEFRCSVGLSIHLAAPCAIPA